jgi:Ca-activated chloride channel family protein
LARSYTRWIIGFPASETNGFPGNLVEPYRAGMTTTTLAELIASRAPSAGNNPPSGVVLPKQEPLRAAMLPHAARSGRLGRMFDIAQQAIALVFGKPSGRIPVGPSRAAVPVGRDVGGAVKRDLPGVRVLILSFRTLLLVCLFALQAAFSSAAQSTSDENKPKDEAKREETKKDDVRKDSAGRPIKPGRLIQLDVDLALLNVTVTDPYNRLVTGLEPDNFRVYEDNIEQEVVTFSAEDVPISIGVIFDFSGSMSNKVGKAREAAVQFFKTANPQDEFFLVSFNERAELTSSFTNSVEDLQSRMMLTSPKGRTALLDALYLGLSQMRGAHNAKRALLILSDGGDNHSRYNESDIKRLVKEADTQLYAIGIFDPIGSRNRSPEELAGPSLLSEVTEMTGGRVFNVERLEDLPDIASKIGMELRNQYVLGYRPSNKAHDARWRKVKIKLRAPKGLPPLSVFSKTGYYAPSH